LGFNKLVNTLAVCSFNNVLYAGGSFNATSDSSAILNRIAQWNGTNWLPLGSGLSNSATSISCFGTSSLFVGGLFSTPAKSIAVYDVLSMTWSALGLGVTSSASSVNVVGVSSNTSQLFISGFFTEVNDESCPYLASWNIESSDWSPVGTSINGQGWAIVVDPSTNTLYIGGLFTSAGGIQVNSIAGYSIGDSTWFAMGDGVSRTSLPGGVFALAIVDSNVIAGGVFVSPSNNIAVWGLSSSTSSSTASSLWSNICVITALLFVAFTFFV